METNNRGHKTSIVSRVLIGLIFLGIGVYLFANLYDIVSCTWCKYLVTWPSILVVIGLILFTKRESRIAGLILMGIGGVVLANLIFEFNKPIKQYLLPIIFLTIGLVLIFKRTSSSSSSRGAQAKFRKGVVNMDVIDEVAIFGGNKAKVVSKKFQGGNIVNIFGGSVFDFMEAGLDEGSNVLDVFCLFGGFELVVPSGWTIKIETVSIFGGISDKRMSVADSSINAKKELVIKGLLIFGGGEVKGFK